MENFREFLQSLEAELASWQANDGGLTMAASDELSAVSFWRQFQDEDLDELCNHLDEDLGSWSWTDHQVHDFLCDY